MRVLTNNSRSFSDKNLIIFLVSGIILVSSIIWYTLLAQEAVIQRLDVIENQTQNNITVILKNETVEKGKISGLLNGPVVVNISEKP